MKPVRTFFIAMFACLMAFSAQAQNLDSVLARLLSSSDSERVSALRQLAKMPADFRAVAPLMNALRDSSSAVRLEALKTWGKSGEAYQTTVARRYGWDHRLTEEHNRAGQESEQNWQKELIASLVSNAEDSSEAVRKEALRTLAKLGPSVESILPPYYYGCGDGGEVDFSQYLDHKADAALLQVGRKQVELLRSLAQDREAQVVYRVTGALMQIEKQPTLSIYRSFLRRPEPLWRIMGCIGLSRRELSDEETVALLSDSDDRVRECALYYKDHERNLLSQLAPEFSFATVPLRRSILQLAAETLPREYFPLVQAACTDPNGEVVADALFIVDNYRVPLEEAFVKSRLQHPHPRVRKEAARLVKRRKYPEYFALLFPLLEDPAEMVREELIRLLYDENDPRLPATLVAAFRRNRNEPAGYIAHALQHSWNISEPIVRRLRRDSDWRLRLVAVEALETRPLPEIIPSLTEAARDSHPKVRASVARLLHKNRTAQATQLLVKLLRDREEPVRLAAISALNGTEDSQARSLLTRLSQSDDKYVAQQAQFALDGQTGGVNP